MNVTMPKYMVFAVDERNVERIPVLPVADETDEEARDRIVKDYRTAGWTVRVLDVVERPKQKYRVVVEKTDFPLAADRYEGIGEIDDDPRCTLYSHDADTARKAVHAAMAVLHPDAEEETT